MGATCGETVVLLWVISGLSLCASLLALWLAVQAQRTSARQAPTRWNIRLAEVTDELLAVQDRLEAMSDLLRKRSARQANKARWNTDEPDPLKDPEGWKRWVNTAGGLAAYKARGNA